jgi:hypothetical protein
MRLKQLILTPVVVCGLLFALSTANASCKRCQSAQSSCGCAAKKSCGCTAKKNCGCGSNASGRAAGPELNRCLDHVTKESCGKAGCNWTAGTAATLRVPAVSGSCKKK